MISNIFTSYPFTNVWPVFFAKQHVWQIKCDQLMLYQYNKHITELLRFLLLTRFLDRLLNLVCS